MRTNYNVGVMRRFMSEDEIIKFEERYKNSLFTGGYSTVKPEEAVKSYDAIMAGKTFREAAKELGVSELTVRSHVALTVLNNLKRGK